METKMLQRPSLFGEGFVLIITNHLLTMTFVVFDLDDVEVARDKFDDVWEQKQKYIWN